MRGAVVCVLLLLLAGAAEGQKTKGKCTGAAPDSLAIGPPIYRDCQVDEKARLQGSTPRVAWSPSTAATASARCYRAVFEFVIDTLGYPEGSSVRRISSTDASFESAVCEYVVGLRYSPARFQGRPVRQVMRVEQTAMLRLGSAMPPGRC